jgi:hypothetical protein
MRMAIDNYTLEKQHAPRSLHDLVREHYLKEIPMDPFIRLRVRLATMGLPTARGEPLLSKPSSRSGRITPFPSI